MAAPNIVFDYFRIDNKPVLNEPTLTVDTESAVDVTAPGLPSVVNLYNVGNGQDALIDWENPVDVDFIHSEIEKSVDGGNTWKILENNIWVNSGVSDAVPQSNFYDEEVNFTYVQGLRYRVRSVDNDGNKSNFVVVVDAGNLGSGGVFKGRLL